MRRSGPRQARSPTRPPHRDMLEHDMAVVISLLRGINVGGHHMTKMDALRALYDSLGLRGAQTYVQSGNVVFKTQERDLIRLGKKIEGAIERTFGFRPAVIVRTPSELKGAIARNPFAKRRQIEPHRLIVAFLAGLPDPEARNKALHLNPQTAPSSLAHRTSYTYFPTPIPHPST